MKSLIIYLSLFNLIALAKTPTNSILSSYWFTTSNQAVLTKVADKFEITRRTKGGFEVLVPFPESGLFLNWVPDAHLIELDTSKSLQRNRDKSLRGYHNFQSVQDDLRKILDKHPKIASIEQYGASLEKRPLLALKLTSTESSLHKPSILMTASTHGDELITVEVLFGLIEQLLSGYLQDGRMTKLLDSYELYFIPVVNPDGYVREERYANGVDPNRDYPWPQDPNHKSNPCVEALMKFYETHKIKASIDFHAYGQMIMYPWAYTYSGLPSFEENVFNSITSHMASFNGYTHGQISKVIYIAKGSSADYFHWKHQSWSLGIEVGMEKVPPTESIPKIIGDNLDSTWTFVESIQ